jgi:hypothetical protein
MKILHVIQSVNPANGGPIEGIRQLSAVNRSLEHTRNRFSRPSGSPLPEHPATSCACPRAGMAEVFLQLSHGALASR